MDTLTDDLGNYIALLSNPKGWIVFAIVTGVYLIRFFLRRRSRRRKP